ncbi:tripartite tricarboxylate transporter TctB family protein [Pelagibius litoralis]|uniref:Tripartite tricarboxylate transporter TctB family protein n=1 Tax=Pelagibius litoralis TaxID=374515 RepID=A0A967EXG4_9PROT|nr:tripartite tricarboxylate transporter TctB family protein [Pelagibius litoralis]NIA69204.1 tripartite tricarboxylate transporter TctB family protein [Pelagibius litoralis]
MASTQESGGKRQIGGELIIPALALGFTLYYISTVINSPWSAQLNAFLVGSVLILLVLVFFGLALREVLLGRATLGVSGLLAPYDILARRLGFMAISLGYLVVIHWLGFTLTTFVFLAASMLLLGGGRRPVLCVSAAAVMATVAFGVFVLLFEKRFPKGPIEQLVQALT